MEEIKFKKVSLSKDADGNPIEYRFSLIGELPPTLAELERTGFIAVTSKYIADYSDDEDESSDVPVIALYKTQEFSEWDDSWTEEAYQIINYDPINGEEIKITVVDEEDYSKEIKETEEKIADIRNVIQSIRKEKLEDLEKELYSLQAKLDAMYSQKGF